MKPAVWIVFGLLSLVAAFVLVTWPGDGGRADAAHFLAAVVGLWAIVCFWSARAAR